MEIKVEVNATQLLKLECRDSLVVLTCRMCLLE